MQPIHSFGDLTAHLRDAGRKIRLAVVCGSDQSTVHAVSRAVDAGFVEAVFVGDCEAIAAVQQAMDGYNPEFIGYRWDDENPRIQLEPKGERGYMELRAVKKV